MSDNKNPEEAVKQLAKAARDLAELRRIVCGDLPAQGGVVSMEDRLGIIERQLVSAAVAQDEPQTTQPLDAGPDFQDLALTDIEWGIPKTDPKSDSTDTIILRPCEADGNEYVDAVDVVVYLRNDRSDVQLGSRGWLAKVAADPEADPPVTAVVGTILSFQRFPWDVGSPAVHGVLIGEGPSAPAVEWARPYSASNTGSVTTIDLIMTDEEGTDLDPEEAIAVYIKNDQSAVNITTRGWDQDTVLSFVRSVENDAGVGGVLIGEAKAGTHENPLLLEMQDADYAHSLLYGPYNTTWDIDNQGENDGVSLQMVTRVLTDGGYASTCYRLFTWDSKGALVSIGAESFNDS